MKLSLLPNTNTTNEVINNARESYDTDFKKGYDESIKGSDDDDDSFGVIGHWGC